MVDGGLEETNDMVTNHDKLFELIPRLGDIFSFSRLLRFGAEVRSSNEVVAKILKVDITIIEHLENFRAQKFLNENVKKNVKGQKTTKS